jgi:hypothetical protein
VIDISDTKSGSKEVEVKGTEVETVIENSDTRSGSKEVEMMEPVGALKPRFASTGSRLERSTEDKWDRLEENPNSAQLEKLWFHSQQAPYLTS